MKSHNHTNPYFQLNHNSFCTTEVYVNDVMITCFKGKKTAGSGRLTGMIPINHILLQSGKYKIVGKMYPRYDAKALTQDNAYLGIEFFLCSFQNCKNTITQFHPKIESPWNGLSENINFPFFEIATEIEVELPFVLDGWQNSVDLSKLDKNNLKKKIFEYYKQIHSILESHDGNKFLAISQEKLELHEQAFYFSKERKKDFIDETFALFNKSLSVEPLNEAELQLQVFGHGKLARLVGFDDKQPLRFKSPNPDEQGDIELDIKLHMRSIDRGFSII